MNGRWAYLLSSPFFVMFLIFGLIPVIYSIYIAFYSWDPLDPSLQTFVGLDNFKLLFSDPDFWNAVRNTFSIWAFSTFPQMAFAIVFALGIGYIAIRGVTERPDFTRRRLVTSAIEHKCILETFARLAERGWDVEIVPVDRAGRLQLDALTRAVTADTALVSVMAANNEIGVVQPIAEIGAIAKAQGALFHVDAAQAAGKIPLDVNAMQIDLLSLTGHKLYGPKGCGALYVRKRTELIPLITGGGQERGLRAGTLNVPGIVEIGRAHV